MSDSKQSSLFADPPPKPDKWKVRDDYPPKRNDLLDITSNRHGGNPESMEANRRIAATKEAVRMEVYTWAKSRGRQGITPDEAAEHFNCSHNHVAPRITELKAMKVLVPNGDRRRTRSGSWAAVLEVKQ
jgi:hypothetical protein